MEKRQSGMDTEKGQSLRPITLLLTIGKVFDKLINKRLKYFVESNEAIDTEQCGYREGMGTLEALQRIIKK